MGSLRYRKQAKTMIEKIQEGLQKSKDERQRKRMEKERARLEEEQAYLEKESAIAAEEQARLEDEKRKIEEERARLVSLDDKALMAELIFAVRGIYSRLEAIDARQEDLEIKICNFESEISDLKNDILRLELKINSAN